MEMNQPPGSIQDIMPEFYGSASKENGRRGTG
jgi:hypothetical protein